LRAEAGAAALRLRSFTRRTISRANAFDITFDGRLSAGRK
jgi:hypothetical protein